MKLRKLLATIFLLTVVLGVVGCSKDTAKKTSSESSTQAVSAKNKSMKKFNSLFGKKYFLTGSYKSKKEPDLNSVSWKKESGQYAFTFVNKERAFAGRYVNGELSYGRMYQFSEAKNDFFDFKEITFVISESRYNRLNQNEKERFTLVDRGTIPSTSKDIRYYQSKNTEDLQGDKVYKFYYINKALIRETQVKKGMHMYAKNVSQD